jgi:hypothetical protein
MGVRERARADEQRASPALDERCEGCLDVAIAADIENDQWLPEHLRRGLHVASLRHGFSTARINENGDCCRFGHDLAQQFQSLWVISGHGCLTFRCPLYPQKRTSAGRVGMSALCQKQTFRKADLT